MHAKRSVWPVVVLIALGPSAPVLHAQAMAGVQQAERGALLAPDPLQREITVSLIDVRLEHALRSIADASGVPLSYSRRIVPVDRRVTLRAERMQVRTALERVLKGTETELYVTQSGQVAIVKRTPPPRSAAPAIAATGAIAGRVTTRESAAPVEGASVRLEGTSFNTLTGGRGEYHIPGVPAGSYTVVVERIGFADARQVVTVTDGREASLDFALALVPLALDEVVVTGTAFETRMRTVPSTINVITSRDIEQKHVNNITDLLRGEIPGVMPLSFGSQDYQSTIYVRGNAGWAGGGDYIKIYIDGVEIARPWALSTIDPRSIERIEVVRGPQSSAIYGSEAASGVLQIFTKKGRPGLDRPQIDVRASVALPESEYTPDGARPVSHDYGVELSGGTDVFSYRVGGGWLKGGEWIRGYMSETLNLSGGFRAVHGPLTAELSVLWSERKQDSGANPLFWRYDPAGCPASVPCGRPDYSSNSINDLAQNTMGLTLSYLASPRWRHTFTLGDDQNQFGYHQDKPSPLTPADTFVHLSMNEQRRRSVGYKTAYEAPLGRSFSGRITAGVDYWRFENQGGSASNLLSAFPLQTSTATTTSVQNERWSNTGYFGMLELGVRDQLYLTFATRVEDNDRLGEEYGRAVSPRAGASYVRGIGEAEVKLRAQYGKGIRPPPAVARIGRTTSSLIILPNPEIGPEEKIGWDAGVEVYWGRRGSVAVTRYDEEGRNLIMVVDIDAASTPRQQQYMNVGRVGSKGWEMEASLHAGPVSFKATYAYADNVIRELSNTYVEGPNQAFQVGDRMLYVPRHSGGATLTTRLLRGSASVNMSVLHERRALDYQSYYGYLWAGEPYRGSMRDYYVEYSQAPKWNITLAQDVTDRLGAYVRVENLTNRADTDISNFYVGSGRNTVLGLRYTY